MKKSFRSLVNTKLFEETYGEIAGLTKEELIFNEAVNEKFDEYKVKFIYAEHVMYSASIIYGDTLTLKKIRAMYTGMIETFTGTLNEDIYKIYAKSLYYLKDFARNDGELQRLLKFYLGQKNKDIQNIKMFKWKDETCNEIVIINKLKFFKERKEIYRDILEKVQSRHLEIANPKGRSLDLVKEKIKTRLEVKNAYKNGLLNEANKILSKITDASVCLMGDNYEEQISKITLSNVNENEIKEDVEKYKLVSLYTHLAGKTGAGKTVYTDIVIKKLTEEGKKILIITDTINNSIVWRERLSKLGIKSAIAVGKSRVKYIESYYNSKVEKEILERTFENRFMTIMRNKEIINNLDEFCLEKNWISKENYKDNVDYKKKCSTCYESNCDANEQKFMNCGYYNLYIELFEANVIIGTAKTLLLSKIPVVFDSRKRTLLEYGVLNSDLVIVDEVDEIQKEFDSAFIDEIKIYSGSSVDENNNRGDIESLLKIVDNIERDAVTGNNVIKEFKDDVRILDSIVDVMVKLFLKDGKQDFIRDYVGITGGFNLISLIEEFYYRYTANKMKNEDKELDILNKKVIGSLYKFFISAEEILRIKDSHFRTLHNLGQSEIDEDGNIVLDIGKILKVFSELKRELEINISADIKKRYSIKFKQLNNTKRETKSEREENRSNYLVFIMFIALIDFYYKKIKNKLSAVAPYVRESTDSGVKDLVFTNLYKDDIPLVPESFIESFISGYNLKEEKENSKELLILKKTNYDGIGREVLFNITKNLAALYDTKIVPMFMASATSIDTKGSMYTVKHQVNRLLENENQKNNEVLLENLSVRERKKQRGKEKALSIKCHIFNDKNGYCKISGGQKNALESNVTRVIKQFNKNLLPDLKKELESYKEDKGIKKGILIAVSSHKIARCIFDNLDHLGVNIKILYTKHGPDEFSDNMHVKVENVERVAKFKVDILIAVNKSVSRGYNIMDESGKEAYFRHIIIANRYLPMPNDNLTSISYLHDYLTRQFMKKDKDINKDFSDLKSKLGKLQIKLKYQQTYSSKEEEIQNMIAGNMFAVLSQLKGRGQRGGASCIIHFIDAAFYEGTAEYYQNNKEQNEDFTLKKVIKKEIFNINGTEVIVDDSNAIFNKFISILDKDDPLIMRLFDDMISAFDNHQLIVHK